MVTAAMAWRDSLQVSGRESLDAQASEAGGVAEEEHWNLVQRWAVAEFAERLLATSHQKLGEQQLV